MAFPSAATKAHLDASSDDPKLARVELASLVDKFNQLLAEVQTATSQAQYDIAHPIHSIMILDWDTAPQVPSGISASWTAIGAGRVLMTTSSGAGDTSGASTASTSSAGGHDHGGNTGSAGSHSHAFSGTTAIEAKAHVTPEGGDGDQAAAPDHTHTFSGTTGTAGGHSHSITAAANHSHSVDISNPPHFKIKAWRRTA